MDNKVGFQNFTSSSGFVGGSAIPVVVYGVISAGTVGADWALRESELGDSILAAVYDYTNVEMFPEGVVFPNGCWCTGGTYTTVLYRKL